MACCDEFQKDENKIIKNGDLKGTTVQGTGALSGSGVVNATSSGTISIEHKTKFSGTGQTSPNTAQSPSFGGSFNVPVVKYDEYGHITGSTTTTVTLPTPEAQNRTELYVGTGDTTTGNTASTNGNTKIKLGYTNGSAWDAKTISGAGATTVTSDSNGNITIDSPLLVDPSISAETKFVMEYLDTHACCKADPVRQTFMIGADTYQMAPWQMYTYFSENYNDGPRIHCPIFKNKEDITGTTEIQNTQRDIYSDDSICGRIFMPRYFEEGLTLCGYDNPCASGGSPKTWTIYNNGGHLSIARCFNHGKNGTASTELDVVNYLRCEVPGCNSYNWPDQQHDDNSYATGQGGATAASIRNLVKDKVGPTDDPSVTSVWCPSTSDVRHWYFDSEPTWPSDRRLKDDIREMSDNEVNDIWERCKKDSVIKAFKLKREPDRQNYGVVAQEIEDLIPGAVLTDGDYLNVGYQIAYGALIGTLIEKVKELEKKVEELEKK